MQFGNWELRDNDYTSYYLSSKAAIFPSSNAVDSGKLNTEENVRNIYRDIVNRNYVLKYNYFSMSLNPTRDGIILSPGEAIINGYHFYAKNSIEVKVPNNTLYNEDGKTISIDQNITQFTLGISLSYDAANHVTGDIVNKEAELGENEVLSGVYVAWFNDCQLEANYDNILILGRAWVQQGKIVKDGTVTKDDRIIYHGFEQDPFKDHKFTSNNVEVELYGHKTTKYDTLRDNMTQIHEPLYTYDSAHFPIELNRQHRTKHPSFVTDIQDYINHVPDWYTSKYGDYMTGALRFNNLSIDAKREFKFLSITKDSVYDDDYSDSVFISPRTYGDLERDDDHSVENNDFDYNVGGTLMTIVPGTYRNGTDVNLGYVGIHAALLAQKYGETGLRLHYGVGNEHYNNNTTRIVHYNENDTGYIYNKNDTSNSNTSKFIIENIDGGLIVNNNGDYIPRKASINIKNGEIFIDTYNDELIENKKISETLNNIDGKYQGSGVQIFASNDNNLVNNVDFRFDQTHMSMAEHRYIHHRLGNRGNNNKGHNDDDLHFSLGLGISDFTNENYINVNEFYTYDVSKIANKDPYFELGNLRIRSNTTSTTKYHYVKQNTIEVIDVINSMRYPYINILPRVNSEQYLAEQLIQIGTNERRKITGNSAQNETLNKIVLKKININSDNEDNDNNKGKSFTYIEQTYGNEQSKSISYNKLIPVVSGTQKNNQPVYSEISGIHSIGNIGCSDMQLSSGTTPNAQNPNTEIPGENNPYADNREWVRFTRFRYDLDTDQNNFGTNSLSHSSENGRQWGSTYNIEFNTQVANRRANQIIWRYKGSTGAQNSEPTGNPIKCNTPPVILSYVHDSPEGGAGYTKYSNVDRTDGYYETWTDHAGVQQFNPTYKIRDFLYLENAGLIVSGDINNPSPQGDSLNPNVNRFGTTILGGRVYNAVYNDFAETYEKDDVNEIAKIGELITLNPETGKYRISNTFEDRLIVGVQSNSYSFLAGGNRVNNTKDVIDLENEYFTVGIAGKVWVRVVNEKEDCLNCYINPGDLLTASNIKGKACQSKYLTQGTIIGKALTKPKHFKEYDCDMVLMQIMLG